MKKLYTYKETKDADYIMRMMEDVFGHRITTWNPADTAKLHNKLSQPVSDTDKEKHVKIVEPLMNKKSIVPKKKDAFLDSFVDMDVRVAQDDFLPTSDEDAEKLTKLLGVDLSK